MPPESFPERVITRAASEAGQSLKNIFTPSFSSSTEHWSETASRVTGETMGKALIEEPARLAALTIGGLVSMTKHAVFGILGWTGRRGLDVLKSLPIFPAPSGSRSLV